MINVTSKMRQHRFLVQRPTIKRCMGNVINEDLACSINYDKCDGINEAAHIFGSETNNQRV